MVIKLNWTEWQYRAAAAAIEQYAEDTGDDLECLLVLSQMRLDLLQAAEQCLNADRQAIREEYGL